MTSGQETEQVYSYNPGARTGQQEPECVHSGLIGTKDELSGGVNQSHKLQSNHHHQQTNIQFFTDQMPFLSPNQQCQSTEGEPPYKHIKWKYKKQTIIK